MQRHGLELRDRWRHHPLPRREDPHRRHQHPETFEAQCASERDLGNAATARMIDLLNQGAFTLEPVERETDKYGRTLRVITRDGESLDETLVDERLAERWKGYRSGWC